MAWRYVRTRSPVCGGCDGATAAGRKPSISMPRMANRDRPPRQTKSTHKTPPGKKDWGRGNAPGRPNAHRSETPRTTESNGGPRKQSKQTSSLRPLRFLCACFLSSVRRFTTMHVHITSTSPRYSYHSLGLTTPPPLLSRFFLGFMSVWVPTLDQSSSVRPGMVEVCSR